jgi:hypothetical protein
MKVFQTVKEESECPVVVALPPTGRGVAGRLYYAPNRGPFLKLIDQGGIEQIALGVVAHYPVICGQLVDGPYITLLDCRVANTNFGAGGFGEVVINARHLLVGIHLQTESVKPFESIHASMTFLNQWIGVTPIDFHLESLAPPEIGRQITIRCKHLPKFGFTPISGGPTLASEQVISPNVNQPDNAAVANQFELCLSPRKSLSLEECSQELFRLQSFISILSGHQPFFDYIKLYVSDGEAGRTEVRFLPRLVRPDEIQKIHMPDIAFPMPLIRESLPELWSRWTERYKEYQSAVELYVSTDMFGGQLLNFQYLAIMQALETLHRNRFGGVYLDEKSYEPVRAAVVGAIPAGTGSDLRSALKARMKYGNEFSLRKRLLIMARGLPVEIKNILHPDLDGYIGKAVDTRNYLTHYTDELETAAFNNQEQYWAIRILRWLFVSVLLKDMGMSDGNLANALRNSKKLANARQRACGQPVTSGIVVGQQVASAESVVVESEKNSDKKSEATND